MVATSNAIKIKSASTTASASGDKRLKGVRMRSWGKWVSEIRLPNSRARLWLGSYATAEQAARAFDVALVCLRGTSAVLNFPQSPPIFAPLGLPHHQIQELAAAAAVAHASPSSPPIANSCCPSPETSSILDELDATAATSSYTNIGCSQSPLSSTSLNDDSVAFEELGVLDHENRPSALMRSSFCVPDAVIHDEFQLMGACTWDETLWANSTLDSNWISVCAPRLPVNDDDDFAAMADPHCLWSL